MTELLKKRIDDDIIVAAITKLIDYWSLKSKLNLTVDPCTLGAPWAAETANPRVACDCPVNSCHITHLNLGQNILSGSIPPEIGNLYNMQYFCQNMSSFRSLGINNFSGLVPVEFGNLTKLKSFVVMKFYCHIQKLQFNYFNRPLPVDFGKLTSLEKLQVYLVICICFFVSFEGRIGDLNGEDSTLNFLVNLTSLSILYDFISA
ncbi:hypothetical protein R6Q59_011335 [Mikania micrantha]